MKQLKQSLTARLPAFLIGLFVLQPLLDVLSFWMEEWGMSGNLTLLLRLAVLAVTVLVGFTASDRKWIYWTAAGICAAFFAAHAFACFQVGYRNIVSDFTNYVRIVQMPVTVLCLITCLKQNEKSFEAMQTGLTLALFITLLVEAVSVITGTDPSTYSDGLGVIGWFNNTNSQSANLSMLVPISLAWQLTWKRQRPVLFWITALAGLFALYFLCPRLAYLGLVVTAFGLCLTIFLVRRKAWKTAVALGLLGVVFLCMIPISPMYTHIKVMADYESTRQGWVNDALNEDLARVEELQAKLNSGGTFTEEERQWMLETLTPLYTWYIGDFVDYFGAEKTIEMYHYSTDILDFSALRPKKLMFAAALMKDSPASSRLFGLELARFTVGEQNYDVENDFHGIYYLCGAVGFALYMAFLAYFVYLIIWALVKNAKRYFTLEAAGYGIAFLLCLAHAYNTAGVLRRPNASIFLSAILAALYYLVRIRKYPEAQTEEALPEKE